MPKMQMRAASFIVARHMSSVAYPNFLLKTGLTNSDAIVSLFWKAVFAIWDLSFTPNSMVPSSVPWICWGAAMVMILRPRCNDECRAPAKRIK